MKYSSALAAVLFAAVGSAHATEFLKNGSFETEDFSSWTLTDPSGLTTVEDADVGYGPESGKWYVYAGPPSSAPGTLSQTFADTAGEKLDISGWAIGDIFDLRNTLGNVSYFFNDDFLGSPDLSSGAYTQSTFEVTATGSDTFTIKFSNDNSFNGLDNFSITGGVATIPEPTTWVLSLLGFAGLGLIARRGRRAPVAASS
jgi:PEP-CTERM motif